MTELATTEDQKAIVIEPPKLSEALVSGSEAIISNAQNLKVVKREDMDVAAEALQKISKQAKVLEAERKDMKAPSLEAGRRVDALFNPAIQKLTDAGNIIKKEMISAKSKFDKEDEEKQAKIMARTEKEGRGRIHEETAINQISEIPTVQKTTRIEGGGSTTFKKVKQVTITDISLIPIEYLRPANVEDFKEFKPWPGISKAAIAFFELIEAGHGNIKQIPGVEVKLVDSLSAR